MSSSIHPGTIVVIDDDEINLKIIELSLSEKSYRVISYKNPEDCLKSLTAETVNECVCVISDYMMQAMTGVDLLKHVHTLDPALSVIITTAQRSRAIIQEALREGAIDFLDKPVTLEALYNTVENACNQTLIKRRNAASTQSLLAAKSHDYLEKVETPGWKQKVRHFMLAKHQLGGDFVSAFETRQNVKYCILGDVSGHDIQSALISSHFLGILEGRRMSNEVINMGDVLMNYNKQLLEERMDSEKSFASKSISLSICSIRIEESTNQLAVINAGIPPLYVFSDTPGVSLIHPNFQPLGWFDNEGYSPVLYDLDQVRMIKTFTDGIYEYAFKNDWDILSLVAHIEKSSQEEVNALLADCEDDILSLSIAFSHDEENAIPLIYQEFAGDQAKQIDAFEKRWKRSLALFFNNPRNPKIDRMLLACREAALNAMNHGCKQAADQKATLSVSYNPKNEILEAVIKDPGEGHDFDVEERLDNLLEAKPGQLGIALISKLVDEFNAERRGATLILRNALNADHKE